MAAIDQMIVAPAGDGGASVSLADVIDGIEATHIEAGSSLVHQGEQSQVAFVIVEGKVRIVADTAYGPVPLATLSAPKLIGEIGALSGLPRTASIVAETALTVHVVPRARLIEVGRANPEFLISIIAQLGRQQDGMNRTLSLYSNALSALQEREFDPRILDDLANPSPQLAEFSAAFRKFAQEIVGKRRQQDEVASAAIIQQSYLPSRAILTRAGSALELHADMRPARNMGGDFYDFFFLDDDHAAIAIGDVCGKGIPASLFMAVVMTVLRMCAREENDVEATIARANALLCRDNATSMFATVFYGVLDLRDGTLDYCNCGHNAPLIIDEAGDIRILPATGLPLGLYAEGSATANAVRLADRDLLVLFTDGVTEATNPSDEEFSEERLQDTLRNVRNLAAKDVVALIFNEVDRFAQDAEQADDITCVVLRCRAAGSSR
jgi:serine phosphatase RsbU (regulator of sigma subunit)